MMILTCGIFRFDGGTASNRTARQCLMSMQMTSAWFRGPGRMASSPSPASPQPPGRRVRPAGRYPPAEQDMVVHQQDAQWLVTLSTLPGNEAPGSQRACVAGFANRGQGWPHALRSLTHDLQSEIPAPSPVIWAGSNPRPVSSMLMHTQSSSCRSGPGLTRLACLRTLLSASWMMRRSLNITSGRNREGSPDDVMTSRMSRRTAPDTRRCTPAGLATA